METFTIKQGNTSPGIEYTLGNYAVGFGILAGATAVFKMSPGGGISTVNAPAVVFNPDGVLRYAWEVGDTAEAGIYSGEFEVTFVDGSVETYPNEGYIRINITRELP